MRGIYASDDVLAAQQALERDDAALAPVFAAVAQRLKDAAPGSQPADRIFRAEGETVFGLNVGAEHLLMWVPHDLVEDVAMIVYVGPDIATSE